VPELPEPVATSSAAASSAAASSAAASSWAASGKGGHPSQDTPASDEPGMVAGSTGDLPARVGRYRLQEQIAQGGMGRIVRVRDEDFDRPLAMKILFRRGAQFDERFLREARM